MNANNVKKKSVINNWLTWLGASQKNDRVVFPQINGLIDDDCHLTFRDLMIHFKVSV